MRSLSGKNLKNQHYHSNDNVVSANIHGNRSKTTILLTIKGEYEMDKENASYEILIDIISNIVKRYIDKEQENAEGDDKCLNVG